MKYQPSKADEALERKLCFKISLILETAISLLETNIS
jgi:hypothetical protein